jgi:hypothetical protein
MSDWDDELGVEYLRWLSCLIDYNPKAYITAVNDGVKLDKLDYEYDATIVSQYSNLLAFLFHIEFYWRDEFDTDEARAVDGKRLRRQFLSEQGIDPESYILQGPCKVLEMLVALAQRAEFTMYDPWKGDRTYKWFWIFMKNLGLDYLTNDKCTSEAENYVHMVITRWLDRRFDSNGNKSPFPIKKRSEDMRKVDIWYQMQWYLAENYELFAPDLDEFF